MMLNETPDDSSSEPYETLEDEEPSVIGRTFNSMMSDEDDWVDGSASTSHSGGAASSRSGVLIIPADDQDFSTTTSASMPRMHNHHHHHSTNDEVLSVPDSVPSDIGSLQDSGTIASRRDIFLHDLQQHHVNLDRTNESWLQQMRRSLLANKSTLVPGLLFLLAASFFGHVRVMRQVASQMTSLQQKLRDVNDELAAERFNSQEVRAMANGIKQHNQCDSEVKEATNEVEQERLQEFMVDITAELRDVKAEIAEEFFQLKEKAGLAFERMKADKEENDWESNDKDDILLIDNCWIQIKLKSCFADAKKGFKDSARRFDDLFWEAERRFRERFKETFFAQSEFFNDDLRNESKTDQIDTSQQWWNSFTEMRALSQESARYFEDLFWEAEHRLKENIFAQAGILNGVITSMSKEEIDEKSQQWGNSFWEMRAKLRESSRPKEEIDAEYKLGGNSFWAMRAKLRERANNSYNYGGTRKEKRDDDAQGWGETLWETVNNMQERVNDVFVTKEFGKENEEQDVASETSAKFPKSESNTIDSFVDADDNTNADTITNASRINQVLSSRRLRKAANVFVSVVSIASVATLLNSLFPDFPDSQDE